MRPMLTLLVVIAVGLTSYVGGEVAPASVTTPTSAPAATGRSGARCTQSGAFVSSDDASALSSAADVPAGPRRRRSEDRRAFHARRCSARRRSSRQHTCFSRRR